MLVISAAVVGIILRLRNFTGNKSFRNEKASPLDLIVQEQLKKIY